MATLIKKTVNGQPRLVDVSNPTPDDMIAPTENGDTSAHAYSTGAFAKVKGVLRKVLSPISVGQAFTDTNSEATSVGEELTRINTDLSEFDVTGTSVPVGTTISEFCTMLAQRFYPQVLDVLSKPVSWFTETAGRVTSPLRIVTSESGPQGLAYGHAITPALNGYTKLICEWSGSSATRIYVYKNNAQVATIAPPAGQAGSYSGEIDI